MALSAVELDTLVWRGLCYIGQVGWMWRTLRQFRRKQKAGENHWCGKSMQSVVDGCRDGIRQSRESRHGFKREHPEEWKAALKEAKEKGLHYDVC